MGEDIADWLNYHIETTEQKLISEFVKKLEKAIERIEYNGWDALVLFKNLKEEYEEKLK